MNEKEPISSNETEEIEQTPYIPRTTGQRALAWLAIAVVLFGLFGTIYWMINFVP